MGFAMVFVALGGIGLAVLAAAAWLVTLPIRILLEPPELTHEQAEKMLMEEADELINEYDRSKR